MKHWPQGISTHTRAEIDSAITDPYWQCIRRGLKGISTEEKLDILDRYLRENSYTGIIPWQIKTQVDNYINALLRGGQLVRDRNNNIVVQR